MQAGKAGLEDIFRFAHTHSELPEQVICYERDRKKLVLKSGVSRSVQEVQAVVARLKGYIERVNTHSFNHSKHILTERHTAPLTTLSPGELPRVGRLLQMQVESRNIAPEVEAVLAVENEILNRVVSNISDTRARVLPVKSFAGCLERLSEAVLACYGSEYGSRELVQSLENLKRSAQGSAKKEMIEQLVRKLTENDPAAESAVCIDLNDPANTKTTVEDVDNSPSIANGTRRSAVSSKHLGESRLTQKGVVVRAHLPDDYKTSRERSVENKKMRKQTQQRRK